MEENENKEDVIYDLESSVSVDGNADYDNVDNSENPCGNHVHADNAENPCGNVDHADNAENSSGNVDNPDNAENPCDNSDDDDNAGNGDDPAMAEIGRMMEEMGAETLLEIIRDNRNAAIRQIISEVEASRRRDIPSGSSATTGCSSIFDLAALA